MKLPTEFPNLDDLLRQMGVPFRPFAVSDPKLDRDLEKGKIVGGDEVEVASNGTLEYKGRKVVLYIRDMKGGLPKYHVVDCRTLKMMRSAGRYKRYVVTRRTDGEFLLNFSDNLQRAEPKTHRLHICKNCLWLELNMKYRYTVDAFPLVDWFNAIDPGYEPPPIDGLYGPITTPITGSPSNYPPDWHLRSLQCRERANWQCEKCRIDLRLRPQRRFLHAHHIRGTGYNNPEDLIALCIRCHAEQPGHSHMRNLRDYQEFTEKYGHLNYWG